MRAPLSLVCRIVAVASAALSDSIAVAQSPDRLAEAAVIQSTEGRVQRNGPELILRAANGTSQTLADQEQCGNNGEPADEDHCEYHRLFAYLPDRHAFIVKNSYFEGGSVTWIDERNGQSVRIEGEPHLSPDGRRFLSLDASQDHPYVIQIWRLTDAMPILEWENQPIDAVGYEFTGWNSDTEVELKYTTWNETPPHWDLPARLSFSAEKDPPWVLQAGGQPH
jgi:hypothetical protein